MPKYSIEATGEETSRLVLENLFSRTHLNLPLDAKTVLSILSAIARDEMCQRTETNGVSFDQHPDFLRVTHQGSWFDFPHMKVLEVLL